MFLNLLLIGTQKGATTSLRYYLETHPEIYIHRAKECKFFVREDLYQKGIQFFKSYFSEYNGEKVIGLVDPVINPSVLAEITYVPGFTPNSFQ